MFSVQSQNYQHIYEHNICITVQGTQKLVLKFKLAYTSSTSWIIDQNIILIILIPILKSTWSPNANFEFLGQFTCMICIIFWKIVHITSPLRSSTEPSWMIPRFHCHWREKIYSCCFLFFFFLASFKSMERQILLKSHFQRNRYHGPQHK